MSRTLSDYRLALEAAGFEILGRLPIFVTMHPALDLPPGRLSRLAMDWWSHVEQALMDNAHLGYRLGTALGWIDRGLTRFGHGGPWTELLVARRRAS